MDNVLKFRGQMALDDVTKICWFVPSSIYRILGIGEGAQYLDGKEVPNSRQNIIQTEPNSPEVIKDFIDYTHSKGYKLVSVKILEVFPVSAEVNA